MSDTFYYPPSTYTPTEDTFKGNLPTGDTWATQQTEYTDTIAWDIFARVLNYLALFVLRPLTSSFATNILTSSFSFEALKSAFEMLQALTDNYSIEHPLVASFEAWAADHGLTIDEPLDEDITIQPGKKGTKTLY